MFALTSLLRWDNKEEFRHLPTYPHHYHDEESHVKPSPLTGDAIGDVGIVLQAISAFLSRRGGMEYLSGKQNGSVQEIGEY